MRTFTLLSLTLLALLLWASCTKANDTDAKADEETGQQETDASEEAEDNNNNNVPDKDEDQDESEEKQEVKIDLNSSDEEKGEDEEEEPPKKEKTTEIEEEKDVMVLHINNFDRALKETEYLLVEFYAPWCGHCRRLEPVFAEAARTLKTETTTMRLAKVDAIEETELGEEFEISSFPTLKLFVKGDRKQPVLFAGKRTAETIVQWMKRRSGPGAPVLDSVEAADKLIESQNITVVGFFDDLESEAAKVYMEVTLDFTDTEFAITANPEVLKKYEAKANSVVLFKKFDDKRADFEWTEEETLDRKNLISFIKQHSLPLVIPFSPESSDSIFENSIHLHCLLFINSAVESQKELLEDTKAVAKQFKGKMLFISIDITESVDYVLKYFGVSEEEIPTVRLINMDTEKKFTIQGELTSESLTKLSQEVVDGTAKPYYRSEEIPEDWNKGPVTVLVAKNFESVAMDPTKNVFVEFYAPWCAHCKELSPIWDQLGEKYADKEDIIIAKMDSTANELENLSITGFPTLKYFPAGENKEAVDYQGERDLETMSKFLDNGGVLPKKEESDDDDDDDDDDDNDDDDDDTDEKEADKEEGEGDSAEDESQESDKSEEDVPKNKTSKDEL